jgi:hypothetical protein
MELPQRAGGTPGASPPPVGLNPMESPTALTGLERDAHLLFHQAGMDAVLIPPRLFASIERQVGQIRAAAFQQVSPFAPADQDLDGRDQHYWHLLICDHATGELLGAQRLSFSLWQQTPWESHHSYLEHCYPGFQQQFSTSGLTYLEVGRVFVAPQARDDFRILPSLMRASGLLARDTGHRFIVGLMSYRFVAAEQRADWVFLDQIRQAPFSIELPVPKPRHPLLFPEPLDQLYQDHRPAAPLPSSLASQLPGDADLDALARLLDSHLKADFQLPGLIRIYSRFTRARVAGLSVARDFNQIVEILMCNDLEEQSTGSLHPGLRLAHRRPWLQEQPWTAPHASSRSSSADQEGAE